MATGKGEQEQGTARSLEKRKEGLRQGLTICVIRAGRILGELVQPNHLLLQMGAEAQSYKASEWQTQECALARLSCVTMLPWDWSPVGLD